MKTPLDNDLNKAYEAFNRDHDQYRKMLMVSLRDSVKQHKSVGRMSHALAFIGDTIMKSRVRRLAAAVMMIIVVLVCIYQLGRSIKGSSVVFGDVLDRVPCGHNITDPDGIGRYVDNSTVYREVPMAYQLSCRIA